MPMFQDLLVLYLLGHLRTTKASGLLTLIIAQRKTLFVLHEGLLCGIQSPGITASQAIAQVMCQHQGAIDYKAQSTTKTTPLHFEWDTLLESVSSIQTHCPLMQQLYLERGKLSLRQPSKFNQAALEILTHMKKAAPIAVAQGVLPAVQFWPAMSYLIYSGEITASYAPTIGQFLHTLETQLANQWAKFLGKHIAKNYTDKVIQARQAAWPDWQPGTEPNPLYGSAPYRTWAQAIAEKSAQVGAPAITQRCYKQVIGALSAENAALFAMLSQS